jgi:16S rRNA (cytosine967-C5)-methyltransferase
VSARSVALDLVEAVLARKCLLDEAFETDPAVRKLPGRDRGFARMLAATVLRRLGQIDDLLGRCLEKPIPGKAGRAHDVLRLGAAQLLFLDTPPHAAISTSVDLLKGTQLAGFTGLVNAVLRRLDREGRDWVAGQNAGRLNTPDWMWHSWLTSYGEATAAAIAEAHLHEAPVDLTTVGDAAEWAERLAAELLPTGSLRLQGGDITELPGFAEGAWWVQDMAAAIPVRLLGDVKGKRVADLCAAPGGKTLQLAAAGAEVTAVDRSAKRLERVGENLSRMGLSAEVVAADVAAWAPTELFDAVLLDAPCTATGTLRRHPDGLRLKKPADVAKLAALQGKLLEAACAMVKPGGLLVYCVCSLEAAEGADRFATLPAGFRRVPVRPDEVGGMADLLTPEGDLRTLPSHLAERGGMDGFHAVRLERVATLV